MVNHNNKTYNLENRTYLFAKDVYLFIKSIPKTITNFEICKQLTRSAGSIGANYIEANEALGKKDFRMHIKISKKEAKETIYWLSLLEVKSTQLSHKNALKKEARELMNILGAILSKS
jgi:four helix bundle protein